MFELFYIKVNTLNKHSLDRWRTGLTDLEALQHEVKMRTAIAGKVSIGANGRPNTMSWSGSVKENKNHE